MTFGYFIPAILTTSFAVITIASWPLATRIERVTLAVVSALSALGCIAIY